MVIKLKNKDSKNITLIHACILGIIICLGIYYFVDVFWNGFFVDWFTDRYMITHEVYSADIKKRIIVTEPLWQKLKISILEVLITTVLICIIVTFKVADLYAKTNVKKSITAISVMLHDFMVKENGNIEIFPKEYAEIAAQISEIKQAMQRHEQILKEEADRKNDLITYLAHDLKTPLTSVIGYLTLLRDERQISEELQEKYLSISLDKAERLEELVNEFFEITRFNLSNITLQYSRVNLTRLLEQTVFEFKPMFMDKGLECQLEAAPDIMLKCDADKIQRVFDNLLRNAVFYSFDNSVIKIIVVQEDKEVSVKFINNGDTIPQEKLGRIFEQFYRLDTSRASRNGGAGLGLAIAKEIVELHNGQITAESADEVIEFNVIVPFL